MASSSSHPLFICRTCIRQLSVRPRAPTARSPYASQTRAVRTHHRPRGLHPPRREVRERDGLSASAARQLDAVAPRRPKSASKESAIAELEALAGSSNSSRPRREAPTQKVSQRGQEETPDVPGPSTASSNPTTKTPDEASHNDPDVYVYRPNSTAHNYYWQTLPPTVTELASASSFFTNPSSTPQFLRSVVKFREFPESDVPEIAFVGLSNAGKSSLLNALVNADPSLSGKVKELARVSKTPGCTRMMNLYGVGPGDGVRIKKGKSGGHDRIVGIGGLLIVDLPGYGQGSQAEWGTEIMKYLVNRKQLRRVFVLVDAKSKLVHQDQSFLASLRMAGVSHQVLMSKLDRVWIPAKAGLDVEAVGKTRADKAVNSNAVRREAKLKKARPVPPHGDLANLRARLEKMRADIQPPKGGGSALGEILGVSSEVLVHGKRLGIDAVRVAVLRAAGIPLDTGRKLGIRKSVAKRKVRRVESDGVELGMGTEEDGKRGVRYMVDGQ